MASQQESNWRPKATKREGLLIEEVGGEMMVYNLKDHRVHCLNGPAVQIWKLCNGKRTVKQIAAELDGDLKPQARELIVRSAIAQFSHLGLAETPHDVPAIMTRRELARKIGAAVALPLIVSIIAPTPANAATMVANGGSCSASSQCISGCCCANNSGGHVNHCEAVGGCGGNEACM